MAPIMEQPPPHEHRRRTRRGVLAGVFALAGLSMTSDTPQDGLVVLHRLADSEPVSSQPVPSQLKVISWNLHGGLTTDKKSNAEAVAKELAKEQPDIGCFQEVPERYLKLMQQADRQANIAFSPTYVNPWNGERTGNVLTVHGKLTGADDVKWYSTDRPTRSAVFMSVETPAFRYSVVNHHLESHNSKLRDEQGRLLSKFVIKHHPSIICGDFNARSDSPTRQILSASAYAEPTCSQNAIDAIYTRKGVDASCHWVDTGSASDHKLLRVMLPPASLAIAG